MEINWNDIKTFLLLVIPALTISCDYKQNSQQKAEAIVVKFINDNLENNDSYESILFDSLAKAKIPYEILPTGRYYLSKMKEHTVAAKEKLEWAKKWGEVTDVSKDLKEFDTHTKLVKSYGDSMTIAKAQYKQDTTLLELPHKFRYYDERKKRHVIEYNHFVLDKDLTKVIGIIMMDNNGELIYYGRVQ